MNETKTFEQCCQESGLGNLDSMKQTFAADGNPKSFFERIEEAAELFAQEKVREAIGMILGDENIEIHEGIITEQEILEKLRL